MAQHFGPPLGPGDDDPRSPVIAGESTARPPLTAADGDDAETVAVELPGPLGPGDDDPRSPVKGVFAPIVPVPGPGDGIDPHEGFRMLAPPPAGAGGTDTGPRSITHVPIKEPAAAEPPVTQTVDKPAAPLPAIDDEGME